MTSRSTAILVPGLFVLGLLAVAPGLARGQEGTESPPVPSGAPHVHVAPDGETTTTCTCRPATEAERGDLSIAPDGYVQDEPRESFTRGEVPLPLVPDWVGTRTRAVGGMAWGDADNDGDLDLMVGTYWANQWPPLVDYYNFLYLNEGGTLESQPSWISVDQKHTTDVKVCDINRDGYPDFFFANGGNSFQPSQVFYGRDGLLPTTAGWANNGGVWSIGAAAADFDSDGDIDVALANEGNSSDPWRPTTLYRNTGTQLEVSPSWASAQVGITNSVDWGDFDGDGDLDLAAAGWSNWQTGVWRNLGTTLETGFAWTTGHPERTDKGIGWALVDADPYYDLAVGGNGAPSWLFANDGDGLGSSPVWASTDAYQGTQELTWVDIDNDGDPDLASVHFSTGHVRIHLNNEGVLSTLADWQYDAAVSATAIAFGDLNGDGWQDLAVGTANGPVEIFVNSGPPAGIAESGSELPRPGEVRVRAARNPVAGIARFQIEAAEPITIERAEVFDVEGRRLGAVHGPLSDARRSRVVSWDRAEAGAPAGLYFLRVVGRSVAGEEIVRTTRFLVVSR
ncbi:MAG: FG-GAP repeat domain-containing protein [Candidatus Eisenbacteria bacterium]